MTLPTLVGDSIGNRDTVVAILGMRYGLTVGVKYPFRKDGDGPAVLDFAEVALREKHRRSSASLAS